MMKYDYFCLSEKYIRECEEKIDCINAATSKSIEECRPLYNSICEGALDFYSTEKTVSQEG